MSKRTPRTVVVGGLIAALTLLLAVAGCGTAGSAEPAASAQAAKQMKIVALDWRYEEALVALGITPAGKVEIGQSVDPSTLTGQLDGVPSVGQAKQPNLEVIASLQPDLILASPSRHNAIMGQLKEIAPTEAYPDQSYTDVLDAMDDIAARTGTQAQAAQVRQRIEGKLGEVKSKLKPGTRGLLIGWSSNKLYTWVDASFPASLMTAAGYEYAYAGDKSTIESKTDVAELTGDKLPAMKADVSFLYNGQQEFRGSPYAAAAGRIIDVEQDVWSRSRGPLAAETMLDQMLASTSG